MPNTRKDWTPRGERPGRIIKAELKKIAPSLAFVVSWTPDEGWVRDREGHEPVWDGDGPDPDHGGNIPHDVDVTVLAIVDGEPLEGMSSLEGVYGPPDGTDPHPDIHGYLIRMLKQAVGVLLGKGLPNPMKKEALAARSFLHDELKRQHHRLNVERWHNQ